MMELYAALDEPNADVDLILGQLADWYCERCDERREAACRWMVAEGKRPSRRGWYSYKTKPSAERLPLSLSDGGPMPRWFESGQPAPDYYRYAVDALAEQWPAEVADWWHALRTRGEEPVAGIAEEVGT